MELLKEEHLLKLYSVYAQDEYELIKTMQNYIRFFTSIILAIIGGALFLSANTEDEILSTLGFIISGIFILGVSYLGYHAGWSNYRRQIESIVKRFKLECLLDLDNLDKYSDDKFMVNEPLILDRYTSSFSELKDDNSTEFVRSNRKKGFMKITTRFYCLTAFIGLIITCYGFCRLFIF